MSAFEGDDVSRETFDQLTLFAQLVERWTAKINLISKPSVPHIWERHINDSVQLYRHAPEADSWVDLGSGGGFPAIVLAILAKQDRRDTKFTMVESDQRKCVFLRTAVRELGLNAEVINKRIESIPGLEADILSARALSDLSKLLEYADLHLSKNGVALFPKGENWKVEDIDAQNLWRYSCEVIQSLTNPDAAILRIKDISHV
ncbi:16S rRNA m(7)G-527 methyltransferase [Sulfitobacter marinus]|uniref:Ribosomal RNA small subunit methyltransferase G n=1 Tax=Sulfitobacter marinus TaxID=394264 RepID=A0A1I6T647_9RHOB|nr:16S rRNA (guanine(527)-N(7))-methyltransferase RsmG [Sulfitobacter marinus]SFS84437.1 16S rRNA m(7)G-527 methyltransferase [Sulfitobacter marinus]